MELAIRLDGLGQAYYRSRQAAGDSNREALRCLNRRLSRVVSNPPTTKPDRSLAKRQRLDIGETHGIRVRSGCGPRGA